VTGAALGKECTAGILSTDETQPPKLTVIAPRLHEFRMWIFIDRTDGIVVIFIEKYDDRFE